MGSMRSGMNNDYDMKSANKKSTENRSEVNEVGSNRQLLDEQNKRSKVEAELNKCRVENGQLKAHLNELSINNLKLK